MLDSIEYHKFTYQSLFEAGSSGISNLSVNTYSITQMFLAIITRYKLLNLENPSPADNEIASLMETLARHAMAVPEITSDFTTTIPPPPLLFNPLPQQATPTPTPTTSEATTSFTSLLDFTSVFKFNDRVTSLERELSKMKQVDQYAQALSSIPAIVNRYIDNKLGEAINKAIQAHNLDCRQEAHDEKNDYIELVDTSMRTIIKEEVTTQLPQILPQAVSDFASPVIEKNVAESLEAVVLKRSSSQPQSTYEAGAALSEFELTKMLIDKMEKNKSYDKAAYKRELYEALVKSYETNKDLFDSYGEVFTLKRNRDDKDKDQDPSDGSDRGMMCCRVGDGTLDDVRSALNDIAKGIRMEYLPKRKWSGYRTNDRAWVMISRKSDKQL
ncbi:hypothetical protein Tco_1504329 [Tanacetum coccineum]